MKPSKFTGPRHLGRCYNARMMSPTRLSLTPFWIPYRAIWMGQTVISSLSRLHVHIFPDACLQTLKGKHSFHFTPGAVTIFVFLGNFSCLLKIVRLFLFVFFPSYLIFNTLLCIYNTRFIFFGIFSTILSDFEIFFLIPYNKIFERSLQI